jgi:Zn ribbon nucleic-acid-binding protein
METLPLKQCPACSKVWTEEEVIFQTCDQCGYPMKIVHESSEYDVELDDDIHD